jgi:Zn finger protein HypA/HybF involved in hydrogenase expression
MASYARDPRKLLGAEDKQLSIIHISGSCQQCGTPLETCWDNAHVRAQAIGGIGQLDEMRAQCPKCKLASLLVMSHRVSLFTGSYVDQSILA